MFYRHHITAIYVTQSRIRSAVFSTGGKMMREAKTHDWNKENIQTILKEIADDGPNVARVVFGEEFSYVTTLASPKGDRASVLGKAREVIPDKLEENWDFRKNKDSALSSQVVAVQADLLDFFVENFEKADFRVEVIEPQSVALARLAPKVGAFMFVTNDEKVLIGAVNNGVVVATHVPGKDDDSSALERFVSSVQKKHDGIFKTVFVPERTEVADEIFSANDLTPEIMTLDPLYAVAIKKHLIGDDAHVLNIKPSKNISSITKQSHSGLSRGEKVLTFTFVLILLLGGVFVWFKKMKPANPSIISSQKQEAQTKIVETPEIVQPQAEPEPVESQAKIDQQVSVLVNNGTSQKGLAKTMADKIAQISGVTISGVGNSKGNFAKTTIIDISEKNAALAEKIAKTLGGEIGDMPDGETKPDSDILVIIGEK